MSIAVSYQTRRHGPQPQLQNRHADQHLPERRRLRLAGVQDDLGVPGAAGVLRWHRGEHHGGPRGRHHAPHEDAHQLLPGEPGHSRPDGAGGGRAAQRIRQPDGHLDLRERRVSGHHLPAVPGDQCVLVLHHCFHRGEVRETLIFLM